jgi:hypothetical protein
MLLLACVGKNPGGSRNLQDSMFGRSGVIDNSNLRLLAALNNAFQIAGS